jgi:hypothetical protein
MEDGGMLIRTLVMGSLGNGCGMMYTLTLSHVGYGEE